MTDQTDTANDNEDEEFIDFSSLNDEEETEAEAPQAVADKPSPPTPAPAAAASPPAEAFTALREAWLDPIRAQYPLADADSIGIKGFDAIAKEEFQATVKASHEAAEKRLVALGYQRGAPDAQVEAEKAAEDARRSEEWGEPVTGNVQVNDEQAYLGELADSMKSGPMGAIEKMLHKGGLAEFALTKSRRG